MAMKVPLSFKVHEKYLYDYLMSKLSSSIYLKQLLLDDYNKANKKETEKKNIFDF